MTIEPLPTSEECAAILIVLEVARIALESAPPDPRPPLWRMAARDYASDP